MKHYFYIGVSLLIIISGCVGPPDYADGLLENNPAIVNGSDYFSLSLLGDKYTENNDWNLLLNLTEADKILITMIVKELSASPSDSSFLYLINEQSDTIYSAGLFSEVIVVNELEISEFGVPKTVILNCNNLSGRLEYQIIKTQ